MHTARPEAHEVRKRHGGSALAAAAVGRGSPCWRRARLGWTFLGWRCGTNYELRTMGATVRSGDGAATHAPRQGGEAKTAGRRPAYARRNRKELSLLWNGRGGGQKGGRLSMHGQLTSRHQWLPVHRGTC